MSIAWLGACGLSGIENSLLSDAPLHVQYDSQSVQNCVDNSNRQNNASQAFDQKGILYERINCNNNNRDQVGNKDKEEQFYNDLLNKFGEAFKNAGKKYSGETRRPDISSGDETYVPKEDKKKLQKYIDKFDGCLIDGILVTESGLLAAAHLGGAGSVKKWFRTGKIRKDGNGVKITTYMERFSGYDLYL